MPILRLQHENVCADQQTSVKMLAMEPVTVYEIDPGSEEI
jgi:hypothetical protein